ncbi:MAG: large extracellular alpha-helical protein, partial [Gammaproteobacteria bacterium]|nr:large extracellular alpha-helical protein [Gammaproteobacteria bacterium]
MKVLALVSAALLALATSLAPIAAASDKAEATNGRVETRTEARTEARLARTPGEALRVVRVTPTGEDVPATRQVVIQFNRPVVPLGRMERGADEIPISIEPALACQWRWLDTSALACQLDERNATRLATRYRVRIEPGIHAEDGQTLAAPVTYSFITERPRAEYASFITWRAPGVPVLRVVFNQPVDPDSVRDRLHLYPTLPATAPDARAEPDRSAGVALELFSNDQAGYKAARDEADEAELAAVRAAVRRPARVWLVMPRQALPQDSSVVLVAQAGLTGPQGKESSVASSQVVRFDTFPAFRFLGVRCTRFERDEEVTISPDTPLERQPRCDPMQGYSLLFSTPVLNSTIARQLRFQPDLAAGRQNFEPWQNRSDYTRLDRHHSRDDLYAVHLPVLLQAFQTYSLSADAQSIVDEFGRPLPAPIQMQFMTAHRRPGFQLPHERAVLERHSDSEVPIYLTNLERLDLRYRSLEPDGPKPPRELVRQVPRPTDIAYAHPIGIRDLLDGGSGAVSGQVTSTPKMLHDPEQTFFAQVTPYQVLVKIGHFSSIAWVTDMRSGEPVIDARLLIYQDRYNRLDGPGADALGPFITDADGVARLPGSEQLDPKLELLNQYNDDAARLFVQVRKGAEMALLPLDAGFHVWPSGVYLQTREQLGHLRAWGTTAQGVYRVGDRVDYKLYVRQQDTHTLVPAPRDGYLLSVTDPKGEPLFKDHPVSLSEFGAYADSVQIPQGAPVGWYRFWLRRADSDVELVPLRVLVADFTPSPFKVETTLNGDMFQPGDTLEMEIEAHLHAGGPFTAGETRTLVRLEADSLRTEHPVAQRFYFDTSTPDHYGWQTLYQTENRLDDHGRQSLSFTLPDSPVIHGRLQVEGSVLDDRGKRVAALATARFTGRDRYVGLNNTSWLYREDQPARVEYLVVDRAGMPVSGTEVSLKFERLDTYAARVKSAGNAYVTRFEHKWVPVGECTAVAEAEPGSCQFTPDRAGSYRSIASINDTRGRAHSTTLQAWVVGQSTALWTEPDGAALQIVPEKTRYQVGDTARYMIRNPLPGALALITVERYGVLRSWLQRFDSSTPVVEFEVKPDFLPGFYLSISLVSKRVDAPLPERGQVDLGKPTSRYGYVQVPVDDPYKMIDVTVKTAQPVYKPRETVEVEVRARARHPLGEPIELAVAVLDESVLDLIAGGSAYFDPYEG